MSRIKQAAIILAILCVVFMTFQYPWGGTLASRNAAKQGLPTTDDGLVDYLKVVNQKLSANVTVDNNVVVDMVQIFGTDRHLHSGIREEFLDWLGNPEVIAEGLYTDPFKFMELNDPDYDSAQFVDTYSQLLNEPWSAEKNPLMATWLNEHQSVLNQLVTASKKPYYFHPLCNDDDLGAVGALLPYAQLFREAARSLNIRAMNRIANGQLEAAVVDLTAARRLGAQMDQAATLVEHLVGYACIGITFQSEQVLLDRLADGAKLSDQAIIEYQKVIRSTSDMKNLAQSMADGERTFMRDTLQRIEQGKTECLQMMGNGEAETLMGFFRHWTNWNVASEICEAGYERLIACMAIDDIVERKLEFQKFEADLEARQREIQSPKSLLKLVAGANSRGELAGNTLLSMLTPAMQQVDDARTRTQSYRISELGFALELYRRANGQFPSSLDALVPEFIDVMPTDPFTGKALQFRLTNNGYRIWSVGRNGVSSQIDADGNLINAEPGEDENGNYCDDIVLKIGKIEKSEPE